MKVTTTNGRARRDAETATHRLVMFLRQGCAVAWAGIRYIAVEKDETIWLQVDFVTINTSPPACKLKRYSPLVLTYAKALDDKLPAVGPNKRKQCAHRSTICQWRRIRDLAWEIFYG